MLGQYWAYTTGQHNEEDSKMFVSDKCDGAITSVFCCELSLTLMCSALLQKICLKEDEVRQKIF